MLHLEARDVARHSTITTKETMKIISSMGTVMTIVLTTVIDLAAVTEDPATIDHDIIIEAMVTTMEAIVDGKEIGIGMIDRTETTPMKRRTVANVGGKGIEIGTIDKTETIAMMTRRIMNTTGAIGETDRGEIETMTEEAMVVAGIGTMMNLARARTAMMARSRRNERYTFHRSNPPMRSPYSGTMCRWG